jgi:CHAT domain-containing protein
MLAWRNLAQRIPDAAGYAYFRMADISSRRRQYSAAVDSGLASIALLELQRRTVIEPVVDMPNPNRVPIFDRPPSPQGDEEVRMQVQTLLRSANVRTIDKLSSMVQETSLQTTQPLPPPLLWSCKAIEQAMNEYMRTPQEGLGANQMGQSAGDISVSRDSESIWRFVGPLALSAARDRKTKNAADALLWVSLNWKGSSRFDIAHIREHLTPDDQCYLNLWKGARVRLSSQMMKYMLSKKGRQTSAMSMQSDVLIFKEEQTVSYLEAVLAARAYLNGSRHHALITPSELRNELGRADCFIDYIRIRPDSLTRQRSVFPGYMRVLITPPTEAWHGSERVRADRYASVYTCGGMQSAVARDLGPAAPIDSLVARIRHLLEDPSSNSRELSKALRLGFKLLVPERVVRSKSANDVLFVSPDSTLHLLPFHLLLSAPKRYVTDLRVVSYVSSAADIVRHRTRKVGEGEVLAIVDPTYGDASSEEERFSLRCGPWQSIPRNDTARELDGLAAVSKRIRVASEVMARPDVLLESGKLSILHVSTHGYRLSVRCPWAQAMLRPEKSIDGKPSPIAYQLRSLALASPNTGAMNGMDAYRSGLVLADANRQRETSEPTSFLTGAMLQTVDLSGTSLVGLAGCESGAFDGGGGGEGLSGLPGVALSGGAAAAVGARWATSGEAFSRIFEGMYRGVGNGVNSAMALRRSTRALREKSGFDHPYYWGTFSHYGVPVIQ